MRSTKYLKIGNLGKSFGKNGMLRVYVEDNFEHLLDTINHIYIWENGQYVPYFIDCFEEKVDLLVKFEEIDDIDLTTKIANKEIFISDIQVNINEYKTDILLQQNELVGFTIYDQNSELACVISDIQEYPSQNMIIGHLTHNEQQVLIPFVDSWLVSIDEDAKEIVMNLPLGLINISEEEE